jgi:hypothetical protein
MLHLLYDAVWTNSDASGREKNAVQLAVSHHLLFISGWIQSCTPESSIRATGIGTVLEQACAD